MNQEEHTILIVKSNLKLHAYILVKGTITVNNIAAADTDVNNANKKVIFKNCAPLFTDCKSEINNVEIDTAKVIDIVRSTYNLIQYSDNYSKTSGSLRHTIKIYQL